MPFVLDASAAAAWCFPDEATPAANRALDRLQRDEAIVPSLWWFEIRNVLVVNERRGRLAAEDTATFLQELERLPIRTDNDPGERLGLALARRHGLTFYDAAYLEISVRMDAPLATIDRALQAAARAEGIALI